MNPGPGAGGGADLCSESYANGGGCIANDKHVMVDKTALMEDDWIVIDGIVGWEALARK